jgi:hypothetical protein
MKFIENGLVDSEMFNDVNSPVRKKEEARKQFSALKEGDVVDCYYPDMNNPPVKRKVLKVDKLSEFCASGVRVQLEGIGGVTPWFDSFWIRLPD